MIDLLDFFRARPKRRNIKLRKKKGVLFSNPSGIKKYSFYVGTLAFFVGIGYILYLYQPLIKAVYSFSTSKSGGEIVNEEVVKEEEGIVSEEGVDSPDYYVVIPKIMASAKLVLGIDPFDKASYLEKLQDGVVAQSISSSLPGSGEGKSIFLFAHSTEQGIAAVRNNAVFYLLGELKNGDPIFIRRGKKVYTYIVYRQEVVNAEEIEYLEYTEVDKEVLILQTCWPIGTNWKRLLVFAEKV